MCSMDGLVIPGNEDANVQNGLEVVQGADIGNEVGQTEDSGDQNRNDEKDAGSFESWDDDNAEERNLFDILDALSATSQSDDIKKDHEDYNDIVRREVALVQACFFDKADRVTSLLNEGADVNCMAEVSGYRISPMHAACFQGHLKVVRILLQHNADINKLMNGRLSSIHLCCIHGKTEILEHILDSPKYDFSKESIRPIFQLACSYGHSPIVEMLLSRNLVNVNERLGNGPSALYSTYWANKIRLAELLLRHGATDDYVDGDGRNILHHACAKYDLNFVKQMIDCKRVYECADRQGDTALHILCEGAGNEQWKVDAAKDILSLLLSAGFNVNSRNEGGQTPFLLAARYEPKLIPILLEHKCDVTIRDQDNRTALHNACIGGQGVDVFKWLISECKLNVNDVDISNSTPLHYTYLFRDLKVIELLIENGALINISDNSGQTALHTFVYYDDYGDVEYGKHDAIKVLLGAYKRRIEKDGNCSVPLEMASVIDAEDKEGLSPLQIARDRADKEAIKILLEYKGQESNIVNSSSSTEISFSNDGYLLRILGISSDEIMSTIEKEEELARRFMGAVYGGSIEEVRTMIDKTDLDSSKIRSGCLAIDGIMFSALDLACYSGNIHMVSMLHQYLPLTVSSDGVVISALLAYIGHHYDIVEYFLVHIQPGQNYSWLLIMACIDSQITLVKSVLDRNRDHSVTSLLSQGELRLCKEYCKRHMKKIHPYGSFAMLNMSKLFQNEINSDIYIIVFHLACYHGRVEIVELLFPFWKNQRHAHVSDNHYGPIHFVCEGSVGDFRENESLYVQILRLLVSAGGNVNELRFGRSPLHIVCGGEERLTLLKELLNSPGILIDIRDDINHRTPLLMACSYGNSHAVSMLLDYGADVNIMDRDGNNPLHEACWKGNPMIIQQLLQKKASTICQNDQGQTPLHVAAACCRETEVFELLLQTKQNAEELGSPDSSSATDSNALSLLDIRAKNGKTALSIAQERGNEEAVEMLQREGALI